MAQTTNARTREWLTDFRTVVLPAVENDLSRRYLQVLMRWVPVALQTFNRWPGYGCWGRPIAPPWSP